MATLIEQLPTAEQLLALPRPRLAHVLLHTILPHSRELIDRMVKGERERVNIHPQLLDISGYGARKREVEIAILEAWAWMESQSILVRTDFQGTFGFSALSLTGAAFFGDSDAAALAASKRIAKEDLHPLLQGDALENFWRSSYDTSVFAAFKAIEVSVRTASGIDPKFIGTDLMRRAFDPTNGPLTDTSLAMSEREALSHLFTGAIGFFKNPGSHRYVNYDADTCADVLVLASRLLKMVDKASG